MTGRTRGARLAVERLETTAYTVPTDAPESDGGARRPDLSRPGLGLELSRSDAARLAVYGAP